MKPATFEKLLESMRQAAAHAAGKDVPGIRVTRVGRKDGKIYRLVVKGPRGGGKQASKRPEAGRRDPLT